MRFLVTGASGFTGSHLCRYLRVNGHEVVEATRASGFDLSQPADWRAMLSGTEAVVHLAARVHVLQGGEAAEFEAENVTATRRLAQQAAEAGVGRFVFISTIGVHGNASDAALTENSAMRPAGGYAQSKWRAEEALRSLSGIDATILCPPLIYGSGVKANFCKLMQAVAKGRPLPFAALNNPRDYLSIQNFCSAVAYVAAHPQAAGETFLLCDGEPLTTPELIRRLAKAMQTNANLLAIPPRLLHMGAVLTRKKALYESVCQPRRINDAKLRALGWQPPQTVAEGLRQTADWYLRAKDHTQ